MGGDSVWVVLDGDGCRLRCVSLGIVLFFRVGLRDLFGNIWVDFFVYEGNFFFFRIRVLVLIDVNGVSFGVDYELKVFGSLLNI